MKKAVKILIIVLVVLGALSVYPIMHFRDISVTNSTAAPYAVAETDSLIVTQGSSLTALEHTVINPCYTAVNIRETVVFSVFDANGTPAALNGTSAVLSAFDIVSDDNMPIKGKTLQGNQAVYQLSEYHLGASKHRYPLLPQELSSAESSHASSYTVFADRTLSEYIDCTVRVDIIIEYSPDGTAWESTNTLTSYLVNDKNANTALFAGDAVIPVITPAPSFEWSLENGTAYLTGMGSVTDAEITVPAHVRLDKNGKESSFGDIYPVSVRNGSFAGNTALVSVTFSDGVSVENGDMTSMFSGCTSLTEVNNIPKNVTVMNGTFMGCTTLVEAPILPEGVLNISNCFADCTALSVIPKLPDSITVLARSFFGCSALVHPPEIPSSATDLNGTFSGCTSLASAPLLPAGVTNMSGTFTNCKSLVTAPILPDSVEYLSYCFYGCSFLDGSVTIPSRVFIVQIYEHAGSSARPLQDAFHDCTSLDTIYAMTCHVKLDTNDLGTTIPIELSEHIPEGYCHYCNTRTETVVIDGITVEFEYVAEPLYLDYVDYIDNDVPTFLKNSCGTLTISDSIQKYYGAAEWLGGYANGRYIVMNDCPEDNYINLRVSDDILIHELTHCYDFVHNISQASAWQSFHLKYIDFWNWAYGPHFPSEYNSALRESFAVCAEYYYTEPEFLKEKAPEAYNYIDSLFCDLD